MHFFKRIYSDLVEFCDGHTDNQTQVLEGIRQLLDNEGRNGIPMPLDFIDYEKLEVWKKLRLKLADEHKEDIDRIWLSWSRTLYRKEQKASLESARCLGAGDADLMFSPPNYAPSVVSDSSPMVLGRAGSSPSISMTSSPASTNLSSSYTQTAANTPWTPQTPFTPGGTPQTPTEDHVIERVVLPVYSDYKCSNKIGEFKYGKKQSDKFVCLTDNCKIKFSKANKIKTQGVSLQTLKSHSLQHHSIELKPREMKAFQSAPLLCEFCSQSFARAQTLRTHIKSKHHETASNALQIQLNSTAPHDDRVLVDSPAPLAARDKTNLGP